MTRIFKLIAFIGVMAATPAFGQMNIGHLDTDSVLTLMPEYKTAMQELETLRAQYTKEIEDMQTELQSRAAALEANSASWTALRVQKERQDLEKMFQNIQEYAQQAEQMLRAREQELLTPVLQKLQDAVNAVGKEKGFNYILNSSASRGIVIFKGDTGDISADVKAKLGIL